MSFVTLSSAPVWAGRTIPTKASAVAGRTIPSKTTVLEDIREVAAPRRAVTLDGTVQLMVEDYADGRSHTRHFLRTARGRVELKFAGAPATIPGAARMRVRGVLQGETMIVEALDSSVQATTSSTQIPIQALPHVLGEQKVAVILVNFQDDTSRPVTRAAAHSLVFDTVNTFYKDGSFGQTWLAGQTFEWVTVPVSKTVCDTAAIANEAEKAVVAAGGNLSGFNRKLYMFPKNACGWSGVALVGENPSQAWINGAFNFKTVGHELGHNLGLRHAHGLDCDASPTGNTCTRLPYGDAADIMGNVRTGQFSAFARERLGWLNDGISPPILLADRNGRYRIESYASSSVGAKAVKIPRGVDANGRMRWFVLEYRQAVAADAVLSGVGNLTQGVMVRIATEGDGDSIDQLDMTPNSVAGSGTDMSDGALTVGRSFTDPLSGVSFVMSAASDSVVDIDVSFPASYQPPPVCERAAPSVTMAGPTSSVLAGTTQAYTITVTNHDGVDCAASNYSLASSIPQGWTGGLQVASITLSPGTSATTTLNVTSPTSAIMGEYNIGAGAASSTSGTGSAGALYGVREAPVPLPPAPTVSVGIGTDKANYRHGDTVYMSAQVKVDGVVKVGASITFMVASSTGSMVEFGATSDASGYARATFTIGHDSTASGNYAVRADAQIGRTIVHETASFTVQ